MESKKHLLGIKKIHAITMLSVAGIAGTIGFYREAASLKSDLEVQEAKVQELQTKSDGLSSQLDNAREESSVISGIGSFLAKKYDEIDALIVKNDSNAVELINWMIANSYYYGDDQDLAVYKVSQWRTQEDQSIEEYREIKASIDKFFSDMEGALKIDPAPSSQS